MRRAIAAAVVGGLVLGGVAATPAFAAAHSADKAQPATHAKAAKQRAHSTMAKAKSSAKSGKSAAQQAAQAKSATKTVAYQGYEFRVPASWPVIRLDENPTACVRYDIHAVYLGTPGANMQCPAGLVGRTQTVSVIPSKVVAAGSGSEVTYQRNQPDGTGGTEVQHLSQVHAAVTKNTAQHELRVALGAAELGATIMATYGANPAVVQQVLDTLRAAPTSKKPATPKKPTKTAAKPAATQPVSTSWHGLPPTWPAQIVQSPPKTTPNPPTQPVSGFDACTAPSLPTMSAWHSTYSDIGVYIGGANTSCPYGNLSASWINTVTAAGWGLLPVYVGPQAPCWTNGRGLLINPSQAAAEGTAAGLDAVKDAKVFGLGANSPIYYDMEGYGNSKTCTAVVQTFLSAWDQQVDADGYLSGVYSSADSGIRDLEAAAAADQPGFTPPDAIWFAKWDLTPTLQFPTTLIWPLSDRVKQYAGNAREIIGGTTIEIDKDLVGGPVAR
jgi:hypothetical protein